MLTGKSDIGLRPENLPPKTQAAIVNFRVYQFLILLMTMLFTKERDYNIVVMVMRGEI